MDALVPDRRRAARYAPDRDAIDMQVISWVAEDVPAEDLDADEDDDEQQDGPQQRRPRKLVVKAFGVDARGRSVAVTMTGFRPFFYLRLPGKASTMGKRLIERKISDASEDWMTRPKITEVQLKDFYGFQNGRKQVFYKLECDGGMQMRRLAKDLRKACGGPASPQLYESNVDPIIRLCHLRDVRPSGWLHVPAGKYKPNPSVLPSTCQYDAIVDYKNVQPGTSEAIAAFRVASFDIECTSSHGDFPMAIKTYRKLASELFAEHLAVANAPRPQVLSMLRDCLRAAFDLCERPGIASLQFKIPLANADAAETMIGRYLDDLCGILARKMRCRFSYSRDANKDREPSANVLDGKVTRIAVVAVDAQEPKRSKDQVLSDLDAKMCLVFPRLLGDAVIQIGTTFHVYGQQDVCARHIVTLGSCAPIEGAVVVACETEKELLLEWTKLIAATDPDILTGWNIVGFDMAYLHDRAVELGCEGEFSKLGRLKRTSCKFKEATLSSSALGDNTLRYFDMEGRVIIDLMKVVQRNHRLDTYKLDNVAETFLGEHKNDVSPGDIFRLQQGDADDRRTIAEYCLQDCALVNRLLIKLETIANEVGMASVCRVPLSFIFLRGQGIKVYSLVLKECQDQGFCVPTRVVEDLRSDDGYEGAIVLEPQTGMYVEEVVAVQDYASLYPSSIIAENLSHDTLVTDPAYRDVPGVTYKEVEYDVYAGKGDERTVVGRRLCRYAQSRRGIIPSILQQLLKARKDTRARMKHLRICDADGKELCRGPAAPDKSGVVDSVTGTARTPQPGETLSDAHDAFAKAVLDGMQLAYKITANSIYGQMGAPTSPVYLKDIAACTTAVGRGMIMQAKAFMETRYGANVVYGDTDSIFCIFPQIKAAGLVGDAAIAKAMELSDAATTEFNKDLTAPQFLEAEKCFFPFCLLSKKRYIGMMYPQGSTVGKRKEMGVALKRRDNAPIVKHVFGGVIDIILKERDVYKSVEFLNACLGRLIEGGYPMDDLVVTKSLRATYSDPTRIAHKVLAERIGERDPGNKPQSSDRVKYVFVVKPDAKLQGERIETPEFIREHDLLIDYRFYITNQLLNPIAQMYAIVLEQLPGYKHPKRYWHDVRQEAERTCATAKKAADKVQTLREREVDQLLFQPHLKRLDNLRTNRAKQAFVNKYFGAAAKSKAKPKPVKKTLDLDQDLE